jgi:glycosyltransferase involved in cell wall biosynthesis
MKKLSVILCTYNEEIFIENTLKKLLKEKTVAEIIIVDDNSKDKTIKLINKFRNKKIKLYIRKKVKGFATALNYGIKKTKYKYILRFDVDMYSNINLFINCFKVHNDKDCIIFSRYIKKGKDLRGNFRKLSSLILNRLCNFLLSNKIRDYTSCIMIFNKNILKDIKIDNTLYANFIIKFIYLLIIKRKKFVELPFTQKKITEINSKSAPNIKIFIKNGLLYLLTIVECLLIKVKK